MGDGNPFFRNWPTRYSGRLLLTAHCSTLRFAKFIGQLVGRKGNQDGLRKGALLPSGKRQAGLKLIPLDLDGYIWSLEWSLGVYASDIRNREAPNFRGWETDNRNFDTQVEQEIKALRSDGEGRELPAQS
jgi:hypothetical protein